MPYTPTITGTVADQTTTAGASVKPFSEVTITDSNSNAADALTITIGGSGGSLIDGAGFNGLMATNTTGVYTLYGSASAITSELDALVFTPTISPAGSDDTSTFKLSDLSNAFGMVTYSSTPTTLASFDGTNGIVGQNGVTSDASGNLFGIAASGGAYGYGTVYEIAATGSGYGPLTTLASFDSTNGAYPVANPITDAAGDLFGTTAGGADNNGTVFEVAKTASGYGPLTVLASLGSNNGSHGALISDAAGDLFGTTFGGGADGEGSVFEIAKTGSGYAPLTTLASFDGANSGSVAQTGLVMDAAGDLFGITNQGIYNGAGAIYEIAKTGSTYSGQITTIASFASGNPVQVILDAAGDLFGLTEDGGANNAGTVFEIANSASGYGSLTTLATFDGGNGSAPLGGLIMDAAGDIFGTTQGGGGGSGGTVFEIAKSASGYGPLTTLVSFSGTDGASPLEGNLTFDAAGDLFGATYGGGSSNDGTVFEIPTTSSLAATVDTTTSVIVQPAPTYDFTTLNIGVLGNYPRLNLNDQGQIVVTSYDDTSGAYQSFLESNGTSTIISDPQEGTGSFPDNGTIATGINGEGQIVGYYSNASGNVQGFVESVSGTFTDLNGLNGARLKPADINNSGEIVGTYLAGYNIPNGFVDVGGNVTTLDDPLGVMGTTITGVNNAGTVVGYYVDSDDLAHGFTESGGTFTTIDNPSSVQGTFVTGINDSGEIVGYYGEGSDEGYAVHGFVENNGVFTTVDDPSGEESPFANQINGVNDSGEIVGAYLNQSDNYYGFSAVPEVACYCLGTLIQTANGNVAVEALTIGAEVVTMSGQNRPIKWIGRRAYSGRFLMGHKHLLPICFKAGAIDVNVPQRDLWVSPHHAMYLHGVLVEARDLVNGVSVVQAEAMQRVEYFHVELDSHDVIVVEGAFSETFVDDDSRAIFHNADQYLALYPDADLGPTLYCAPRENGGYAVEAARRQIDGRAGLLPSDTRTAVKLRGFVDATGPHRVSGWAQNPDHPEVAVCLDIYVAGKKIGQVLANHYRRDLEDAGLGSGRHSFAFALPEDLACVQSTIEVRRSLDDARLPLSEFVLAAAA